jgi:hypothetical protein
VLFEKAPLALKLNMPTKNKRKNCPARLCKTIAIEAARLMCMKTESEYFKANFKNIITKLLEYVCFQNNKFSLKLNILLFYFLATNYSLRIRGLYK